MPRRHDSARERPGPPPPRPPSSTDAPKWAEAPGVDIRTVVASDKTYRCPGCDHEIRPRVQHLVVVPDGDPESRRHWHTECWRRELRRTGGRSPS